MIRTKSVQDTLVKDDTITKPDKSPVTGQLHRLLF